MHPICLQPMALALSMQVTTRIRIFGGPKRDNYPCVKRELAEKDTSFV